MSITNQAVLTAAENYWKTDTTGKGHLARGQKFHEAREELVNVQGLKKGEAQKLIAQAVQDNAPAHEKKFGAATVSHYTASYALLLEETSNFRPVQANADLYAVVHKAYAASMGVENLRNVLLSYTDLDKAIQAVAALKRGGDDVGEDGEPKPSTRYSLKTALSALAKIQEWEWTEDEKGQLFTAALATSVAVQPDN